MDTEAKPINHPTREKWMDYLYGECEPDDQARLGEHLDACPDCRREVTSWRGVLGELDTYAVAKPVRRRTWVPRLARWAVAAAVLIAVGYGLGRAPATDVQALRAQIEPALREAVARQMRAEWQADLAAARAELSREADERALWTLSTANSVAASLMAEYVEAFDNVRRSDLLALATVTEQELRRTRWQLAGAVARARPASSPWTMPESPAVEEGGNEG